MPASGGTEPLEFSRERKRVGRASPRQGETTGNKSMIDKIKGALQ